MFSVYIHASGMSVDHQRTQQLRSHRLNKKGELSRNTLEGTLTIAHHNFNNSNIDHQASNERGCERKQPLFLRPLEVVDTHHYLLPDRMTEMSSILVCLLNIARHNFNNKPAQAWVFDQRWIWSERLSTSHEKGSK
jgi:hypothetical protein